MADDLVEQPVDQPVPTETPVDTPAETPVEAPETPAPSDLEAYLADQLKEAPAETPQEAPVEVPEAFQKALQVSEWVKSPDQVEHAVRAADEVWKVQTGQLPAWQMIDAVKSYDPARYEAIVNEIIPYLEQVTGKKFGDGDPNAAPDPVAQLRTEIAQRDQEQRQQQEQYAYQQQVSRAVPVLKQTIADSLGKTFGEENVDYFMSQIPNYAKVNEQEMVAALNRGDKAPLEAAIKAVKTAELKRFASYNKALVQQAKDFRKSVPVAKGAAAIPAPDGKHDLTTTKGRIAYATEAFNS